MDEKEKQQLYLEYLEKDEWNEGEAIFLLHGIYYEQVKTIEKPLTDSEWQKTQNALRVSSKLNRTIKDITWGDGIPSQVCVLYIKRNHSVGKRQEKHLPQLSVSRCRGYQQACC